MKGRELPSGQPAYLPAELVFLGPAGIPGERPVAYATSSGLACGESVDDTLQRGLCEVLERDAFMIVWANRLSLPILDESQFDPWDSSLLACAGLQHAAVDLSVFHRFPVVLGVVRAPAPFPGAVGVGAAAAPTVERAWWKALSEAFACRAAGAKLELLEGRATAASPVATFEDHIRRYAAHELAPATAFLDASAAVNAAEAVPALEGDTAPEWIDALCRRVCAAGSTAYAVDVTAPDVSALGLTVTRVIAPELCRLDVPHDARFLGGRRLYETATRLGLRTGRRRPTSASTPTLTRSRDARPADRAVRLRRLRAARCLARRSGGGLPRGVAALSERRAGATGGAARARHGLGVRSHHHPRRAYPRPPSLRCAAGAALPSRAAWTTSSRAGGRVPPRSCARSRSPSLQRSWSARTVPLLARASRRGGRFRPAGPSTLSSCTSRRRPFAASPRGCTTSSPSGAASRVLAPLDWSRFRAALVDPSPLDTSAALVVVTAVFWRSRIKYGLRGYRFALLEAGHLVQTIQLAATDLGLSALPVGGFFDRRLDELVGADGLDEAAVYAVALGGSL